MKKSIKTRIISIATAALMTLSVATATMASASAATVEGTSVSASQSTTIKLNISSEWKMHNANFGAYFFNEYTGANAWTKVDCRGYMGNYASINGDYTHVIFVRLKDANLDWSNAWNKTADLRISDLNGSYTINGWELDANAQAAAPAPVQFQAPSQEIKLNVNISNEWKMHNANFGAYFFNEYTGANTWAKVDCRGYMGNSVTVNGDYTHVLFVRLKDANLDWSNAWNKTPDLRISDLNGSYTINGWELDA